MLCLFVIRTKPHAGAGARARALRYPRAVHSHATPLAAVAAAAAATAAATAAAYRLLSAPPGVIMAHASCAPALPVTREVQLPVPVGPQLLPELEPRPRSS